MMIKVNVGEANERVAAETDFTMGDKTIYSHWTNDVLVMGPLVSGFDGYVWEMFNVSRQSKSWNEDGETTALIQTSAAEREFNEDGYLVRQVVTEKNLLKQEADEVREMSYEYIE
jgi:hypothetical protein